MPDVNFSIQEHKSDNRFYVAFNLTDKTGCFKRKYLSTGVKIPKGKMAYNAARREAESKAQEIINRILSVEACSDIGNIDPNTLFCDYLKNYVERRKGDVAPTTYDNDVHYLNKHIYSWF